MPNQYSSVILFASFFEYVFSVFMKHTMFTSFTLVFPCIAYVKACNLTIASSETDQLFLICNMTSYYGDFWRIFSGFNLLKPFNALVASCPVKI